MHTSTNNTALPSLRRASTQHTPLSARRLFFCLSQRRPSHQAATRQPASRQIINLQRHPPHTAQPQQQRTDKVSRIVANAPTGAAAVVGAGREHHHHRGKKPPLPLPPSPRVKEQQQPQSTPPPFSLSSCFQHNFYFPRVLTAPSLRYLLLNSSSPALPPSFPPLLLSSTSRPPCPSHAPPRPLPPHQAPAVKMKPGEENLPPRPAAAARPPSLPPSLPPSPSPPWVRISFVPTPTLSRSRGSSWC